jgi:3-hydroxyacyl-[acyl-carrier-protein] dehydratase
MPGVLIVEAMAQTAAVLVVHSIGERAAGKLVYFTSIDSAKFRRPVTPGDTLHIHVERVHSRGMVWKFNGRAMVNDKLMAEATYAAMIMDNAINADE